MDIVFIQLARITTLANFLQGSESAYLYGITFLIFFPVFCVCAGYGLIKITNRRRKAAKNNQPETSCFKGAGS